MAAGAGPFDGEEALLGAHLAHAATGRAGLGLGAGLGSGAGTGFADDGCRQADLSGLAAIGVFQRDFHVVAQVGAALTATTGALTSAAHAEQIVENIREAGGEVAAKALTASAGSAALLERGMAVAVIGGALVAILQDLVGLVDFLELVL